MRQTHLGTLAFLLIGTLPLQAQQVTQPTKADLETITARGRQMAAYDMAAGFGTDAVMELKPDTKSAPTYIAMHTEFTFRIETDGAIHVEEKTPPAKK